MQELPQKLLRYLRVAPGSEACRQAQPLWGEALALAEPRTWNMRLGMGEFLDQFAPHAAASKDLARTLKGCETVELMAATIGEALETRSREYFTLGRPFAGYMLDRMGSYLAESTMRELHAKTRTSCAKRGGRATRRYSPGYGDFPLEAQAHFLGLIKDALPGLRLTSGFILVPEKSVTAVCGCTAGV